MAESAITFIGLWAESVWAMLSDSALYFLAGLVIAGILWLFLNERIVRKWAGGSPVSSVLKAALIGLPLPLCSCSVLPVATQLRKAGFSRSGVMAFLVSTPESGVDSILLTYALTDPVLTVARPISAYLSAAAVGITEAVGFERDEQVLQGECVSDVSLDTCSDGRGCDNKAIVAAPRGWLTQIWNGIKYAFTDLLADLAPYMLTGFLLAGLIDAIFRATGASLPQSVTSGWIAYAWAVIVGVPLYVCATSSTPLAAVLLGAGFSPGAILVFLLVGPATNLASLMVLRRILGGWPTVRYVITIVVVAILCGLLLDRVYDWLKIAPSYAQGDYLHEVTGFAGLASAVVLSVFILYYSSRKLSRRLTR